MAFVVALLSISIAFQASAPTAADGRWLDDVREPALDVLMPVKSADQPLVAYRSYRDLYHDVLEKYFTISFADGGFDRDRLIAMVIALVEKSVQQQLLDAHMKDRQASLQSLLSSVAVRKVMLNVQKCPAIRTRLDALSTVTVGIPKRDAVFLHPIVHRAVLDMAGIHIDVTVFDGNNALVRWASETADVLLTCAKG
jgi:hypothetical protein